jgi:hypothetical protein
MSQRAPVPTACPQRAHGHSMMSVPLCPMSLDMGTGKAHHQPNKTSESVPNERRRLYRRPTLPTSPPIRRGRLRRVQAEKVTPHRAEGFVTFNDGNKASVMRGPILDGLRLAERNGSMMDVELADYGSGWMVERILPASDQWRALEVVC